MILNEKPIQTNDSQLKTDKGLKIFREKQSDENQSGSVDCLMSLSLTHLLPKDRFLRSFYTLPNGNHKSASV